MVTTPSALERNAAAADAQPGAASIGTAQASQEAANVAPQQSAPRRFNLQQELLAREFHAHYGISPSDIYFEGDSAEPYFSFEALSSLTMQLAPEVIDLRVEAVDINQPSGLVLSRGTVVLTDGRSRSGDAGCALGDILPSGMIVETFSSALNVAEGRAAQKALRMIGFDPVRAHQAKKASSPVTHSLTPEDDQRNKELAEIHILAEECGLITGTGKSQDKTKYYQQLGIWFDGKTSAEHLDARQRAQFIALLRSTKSARERASNEGQ